MTTLQDTIAQDWKEAMKARDPRKDVLSLIKTELKNKAINERTEGGGLALVNDEEAIGVLQKMAKQRKESIESYRQGNRQDLADKETFELSVIEAYLPKQMSEEELAELVRRTIQEVQATSIKDLGKVMGAVLKIAKGRVDGKMLQDSVRSFLQNG